MARPRFLIQLVTLPSIMCLLAVGAGRAVATTWRVELDGSGDFSDIQPAVDAAASGDTILVGPGRFDMLRPAPGKADVVQVAVAGAAQGVSIAGCAFSGSFAAITFGDAASGSVSDCSVAGAAVMSLGVTGGAHVTVDGLTVDGGDHGISAGSGAVVTVHASALEHTLVSGVTVTGDAVVTVHGSHLLPGTGYAVSSFLYPGAPVVLDFTGNFWGTTDNAAVGALIHDSADDAAIHCTVDFAGASATPLGETPTSWGDLKASFR